jgi:hypothetical protein
MFQRLPIKPWPRETSDPDIRVKIVGRYGYKSFMAPEAARSRFLHVRHGARRPWSTGLGGR